MICQKTLSVNKFDVKKGGFDLNRKYLFGHPSGDSKPTTTTIQVVALPADPRAMLEISTVAFVD